MDEICRSSSSKETVSEKFCAAHTSGILFEGTVAFEPGGFRGQPVGGGSDGEIEIDSV